jgi:hypothetical protein
VLPSLFASSGEARPWGVARAAGYGAGIGIAAAVLRLLGPAAAAPPAPALEILGAALGFALLCAAAAALRNFIARHLIWPDLG